MSDIMKSNIMKNKVPTRSDVPEEFTWDLSSLFKNGEEWDSSFREWEKNLETIASFQGRLHESADMLAQCLHEMFQLSENGEALGTYAHLVLAGDGGDPVAAERFGRFMSAAGKEAELTSFIAPEILAIDDKTLQNFLQAEALAPYKLWLQLLLEEKPHTLGAKEEKLLAMQTELLQTPSNVFDQLTDVDMKFGTIQDHSGETIELSHATYSSLLHGPNRDVRRQAFKQYYQVFDAHKNMIAATYAGSVQQDVFFGKARGFASARERALFVERVPIEVYDRLVDAVRQRLPVLYRYYEIRRKLMNLDDIHMYDTYAPIFPDADVNYPWDTAVEMVLDAVAPLGNEYVAALKSGFKEERWCDRYENQGKSSGAFSCGSFRGKPYILMNFKSDVLDHVFTLAHEAGHSMHTWYSVRNQTFPYYNYTLFAAEVASTFNEQLLHHALMSQTTDVRSRLQLINRQVDAIRATIFRQTMFAEFERETHAAAERGEALTLQFFRSTYQTLLEAYFGERFTLDDELSLECLRIPHFYHAFYVYKYATGLSAAIALSRRVLEGGAQELDDYLGFLKAGGSLPPIEALARAGVDMRTPQPVLDALEVFESLVADLEDLSQKL